MTIQPRRLIDIALNEFNYILDINLTQKRVEQIVTKIPQINSGITLDYFLNTFGSNVPPVDKPKCQLLVERIKNALNTQDFTPFVAEIRFSNYVDKTKFDWSSIKCIFDTTREDLHVFVISRDITVEKANEIQVIQSSQKDSLTDLLNRYAYNFLLKRMLVSAQNENSKIAFFFIDIDNFKDINDLYGHQEGDRILVEVASLLKKVFIPPSIIGRYGGDEFVAIYPNFKELDEIKNMAKSLCEKMRFIKSKDSKISISCSVGISLLPDHSKKLDELIHFSDLALYYAKHLGKDQYYIFDKNNNKIDIAYSKFKPENQKIDRQELLENILADDKTAILVTDAENYRILFANKAYCSLFGFLEQDIYNEDKTCYSILKGSREPCKNCILNNSYSETKVVEIDNKKYIQRTSKMLWKRRYVYIIYYSEE